MNKKELFEVLNKKINMQKEEFDVIYSECEQEIKDRGIKQNIEQSTIALVHSKAKKKLSTPAKVFSGIIIGKSNIIDFARSQRDLAKKKWTENPELAIKEGYCDAEGNALYKKGFEARIGQKIPENDFGRSVILLAKIANEPGELRETVLNLRGEKCNIDIPTFREVEFMANVGKDSNAERFVLNQSTMTEFKVTTDKPVNFPDIALKHLRKHCVALKSLREYHQKVSEDFNRYAIFKANITDVTLGEVTPSNIVRVDDMDLDLDERITCWIPKDIPIEFYEGALGVFFIGRTNINDRNEISVNVLSIFTPDNAKKAENVAEIKATGEEW